MTEETEPVLRSVFIRADRGLRCFAHTHRMLDTISRPRVLSGRPVRTDGEQPVSMFARKLLTDSGGAKVVKNIAFLFRRPFRTLFLVP